MYFGLNSQNKQNEFIPPPPPLLPDSYPEFSGGDSAFNNFIISNLKYPDLAKQKNDIGICQAKFTVNIDGSLQNISIVKLTNGCLECDQETKRLISIMPKWKPALKNGKPIVFDHSIALNFSLEKKQSILLPEQKEPIFTVVEEMPQFPGGETEKIKFIQKNLVFPESAIKNKTYGKCFLKFVVNKDGHISDISVLKGVSNCPECDEEAKRVISIMPNWIPGKQNGRQVAVFYNIPFNFQPR